MVVTFTKAEAGGVYGKREFFLRRRTEGYRRFQVDRAGHVEFGMDEKRVAEVHTREVKDKQVCDEPSRMGVARRERNPFPPRGHVFLPSHPPTVGQLDRGISEEEKSAKFSIRTILPGTNRFCYRDDDHILQQHHDAWRSLPQREIHYAT